MKNKILVFVLLMVGFVFGGGADYVNAQEALRPAECFDFLNPLSVSTDVNPELARTLAGSQMRFYVNVVNQSNVPIVDGSIYVKVFQTQTDTDSATVNGHFLVDQFVANENVSVSPMESKRLDFTWIVPAWATEGEYRINTYLITSKKFDVAGLVDSDLIYGGITYFDVTSETKRGVRLDKNNVTVDDVDYFFENVDGVEIGTDTRPTIKLPLINLTTKVQDVKITYKLVTGGLLNPEPIDTKREEIQIAAGKTQELAYQIVDTERDDYILIVMAEWHDSLSIVDVNLRRGEAGSKPSIGYLGLSNFPINSDTKTTVFSCLAGVDNSFSGNLTLTLLDDEGQIVSELSYANFSVFDLGGLKAELAPGIALNKATLKATLGGSDNKVQDTASVNYDCNALNSDLCITAPNDEEKPSSKIDMRVVYIVIGALVLILLAALFWFIKKKKHEDEMGGGSPPVSDVINPENIQ